MNKEKEFQNAKQIVEEIQESYTWLYEKYGIEPNVILLSGDVILKLIREHAIEKTIDNKIYITQIMGMNVSVVEGVNIIKAAIILED